MKTLSRRSTLLLILGGTVAAFLVLVAAARSAGAPFLASGGGARWVLYPTPPRAAGRPGLELETRFRRSFDLEEVRGEATVDLAALGRASLTINGAAVPLERDRGPDARARSRIDVTRFLAPGENRIVVSVRSSRGPPALRLELRAGDFSLGTDASWESSIMGAAWRPARHAGIPMSRWARGPDPTGRDLQLTPFAAFLDRAPTLLLFGLLGLAAHLTVARFAGKRERVLGAAACASLLGVYALLVGFLFLHNAESLSAARGFDAEGHVEYVDHILRERSLPLADEGWEMYQPPLYYAVSAGLLALLGHGSVDELAADRMRWVNAAAMVLHGALVLLCLRRLFPGRSRLQVYGFLLAAFLPAQLYVSQYLSNEALSAALVSLCVWLTLRLLDAERPSLRASLGLGVALGAALLAKFSALIALPLVFLALVVRWAGGRVLSPAAIVTRLSAAVLGVLAVAGWHYLRVWHRFGKPLVGNWDEESGFGWWQDPGFHTAGDYLPTLETLHTPFFAGFHSFWDGMFSTLFGDGLAGGSTSLLFGPPWNLEWVSAGYVLALVPAAAGLLGLALFVARFVRKPRTSELLVLGLLAGVLFATVFMTLKLPFYAQARSIYGLSALVPLSAAFALGLDRLAGRSSWRGGLVSALLAAFLLNAYASSLADADAPRNLHARAMEHLAAGRLDEAGDGFARVLEREPRFLPARRGVARLELRRGNPGAALEEARGAAGHGGSEGGSDGAGLAEALELWARAELELGRFSEAAHQAWRGIDADPDRFGCWKVLAEVLVADERPDQAVDALREALAASPESAPTHHALGGLLWERGERREALQAFSRAAALDPGNVRFRRELASRLEAFRADAEPSSDSRERAPR